MHKAAYRLLVRLSWVIIHAAVAPTTIAIARAQEPDSASESQGCLR